MSPAKSRKAARKTASRRLGKAAKKAGKARRTPKAKPAGSARKASSAKPRAAPSPRQDGHAHCAATDPFGDPCQNVPRRPSRYCVIHSYLER